MREEIKEGRKGKEGDWDRKEERKGKKPKLRWQEIGGFDKIEYK